MKFYDTPVCVVGAGPAGSTASLFLTKYGIPHILVDRETFPRDKVCGEQFSGRVNHVLRELNPNWEAELVDKKIMSRSWHVNITLQPEDKKFDYNFSQKKSPTLKAKRSEFDYFLFQKAKESPLVTCLEGVYLTHYEQNEQAIQIQNKDKTLQINAQLVLFCTGEKIPFFKKIFPETYRDEGKETLFVRRYYRAPPHRKISNVTGYHLVTKPIVHIIINYELANGLIMIELGTYKEYLKDNNIQIEALFENTLKNTPIFNDFLYGTELVQKSKGASMLLGKNPRLLSAERFLLVGSAMGSINPITGFGVGHAMRSAQIAAYWAAKSIAANDFSASFLKQYDAHIMERMKSDFRLGYVINWAFRNIKMLIPLLNIILFTGFFVKLMEHFNTLTNSRLYVKRWFTRFSRAKY